MIVLLQACDKSFKDSEAPHGHKGPATHPTTALTPRAAASTKKSKISWRRVYGRAIRLQKTRTALAWPRCQLRSDWANDVWLKSACDGQWHGSHTRESGKSVPGTTPVRQHTFGPGPNSVFLTRLFFHSFLGRVGSSCPRHWSKNATDQTIIMFHAIGNMMNKSRDKRFLEENGQNH